MSKRPASKVPGLLARSLGLGNLKQTIWTVGAVSVAAGLLFAVAVSSARHHTGRMDLDLEGLVRNQQAAVSQLETEVGDLSAQADRLAESAFPSAVAGAPRGWATQSIVGPGVIVTMDDAPAEFDTPTRTNVNDLVVHQQDVDAVMNALWRGGAEAMTVQGVRITNTTPVRCVGSVILIGVQPFAPPYVIEAIGDSEELTLVLAEDPQVERFRQAARIYHMGWEVEAASSLTLPAAPSGQFPMFAAALESA